MKLSLVSQFAVVAFVVAVTPVAHAASLTAPAPNAANLDSGDRALASVARGIQTARHEVKRATIAVGHAVAPAVQVVGKATVASVNFAARHTWNGASRIHAGEQIARVNIASRGQAVVDRAGILLHGAPDSSAEVTRRMPERAYTVSSTRFVKVDGERMRITQDREFTADTKGGLKETHRDVMARRSGWVGQSKRDFGGLAVNRPAERNPAGGLDLKPTEMAIIPANGARDRHFIDAEGMPTHQSAYGAVTVSDMPKVNITRGTVTARDTSGQSFTKSFVDTSQEAVNSAAAARSPQQARRDAPSS